MNKFKVGDRVVVYHTAIDKGTVVSAPDYVDLQYGTIVAVKLDFANNTATYIYVHYKQCRKLVPKKPRRKKPRRKIWVNTFANDLHPDLAYDCESEARYSSDKFSTNVKEVAVEFIEVRKKKDIK